MPDRPQPSANQLWWWWHDLPAYFETFGGAVLSATINKYFYTIVSQRADSRVQIISSDLQACESWPTSRRLAPKAMPWRFL